MQTSIRIVQVISKYDLEVNYDTWSQMKETVCKSLCNVPSPLFFFLFASSQIHAAFAIIRSALDFAFRGEELNLLGISDYAIPRMWKQSGLKQEKRNENQQARRNVLSYVM